MHHLCSLMLFVDWCAFIPVFFVTVGVLEILASIVSNKHTPCPNQKPYIRQTARLRRTLAGLVLLILPLNCHTTRPAAVCELFFNVCTMYTLPITFCAPHPNCLFLFICDGRWMDWCVVWCVINWRFCICNSRTM